MHKVQVNKIDNYIQSKINDGVFSNSISRSIPIVTEKNGKLYYAIFLYDDTVSSDCTINRPFVWALLPTLDKTSEEFSFNYCSIVDFIKTETFPFNREISATINSDNTGAFSQEMFQTELTSLMYEIANFAFSNSLTDFQENIIIRFRELFLEAVYVGLYPFYDAIAEDFFEWIGLTLIAKSDNTVLKNEIASDILSDIRAILPEIEYIKNKLSYLDDIGNHLNKLDNSDKYGIEKEIILVIDHINKSICNLDADDEKNLELIMAVRQDLVDLLYRHNVEPFNTSDKTVDFTYQKVIDTMPTDNEDLHSTVYDRLTQGWMKNGVVIRPEHVIAYLYQ